MARDGQSRAQESIVFSSCPGGLLLQHRRPSRLFRLREPAERDRRRRDADHLLPPHPHQGRPDGHLQGERPLQRRGPRQDQSPHARLARIRADQDGSPADRRALGGASRGRRQGADLDSVRIPLARDQLGIAPALERSRQAQPAHARQGDRLLHSRRTARSIARRRPARPARRRRLLPHVGRALRAHGYRQRAALAAHAGGAARNA